MNEVTIEKDRLKAILEKNREQHYQLFVEAHDAFRQKAIKNAEALIDSIRDSASKPVELNLRLIQPEDHTKDYDRALLMLDLEIGDTVTLRESEFAQLVQDDWGWKAAFGTAYASNTGKTVAAGV